MLNLSNVVLPFAWSYGKARSLDLYFTPTTNGSLYSALCNGVDRFTVAVRTTNDAAHSVITSNATNITLQLNCEEALCSAGQQRLVESLGASVCVKCPANEYNLDANSTCKPCPSNGECPGGDQLLISANHWFVSYQGNNLFYKCVEGRCCPQVLHGSAIFGCANTHT